MREGPAADASCGRAARDAAMTHEAQSLTYNATISACKSARQRMPAAALLREMQRWHMQPNAITCNAIISAGEKASNGSQRRPCSERCSCGTWSPTRLQRITATTLLRDMQQWHVPSDAITCNSTSSACKQSQQQGPAPPDKGQRAGFVLLYPAPPNQGQRAGSGTATATWHQPGEVRGAAVGTR